MSLNQNVKCVNLAIYLSKISWRKTEINNKNMKCNVNTVLPAVELVFCCCVEVSGGEVDVLLCFWSLTVASKWLIMVIRSNVYHINTFTQSCMRCKNVAHHMATQHTLHKLNNMLTDLHDIDWRKTDSIKCLSYKYSSMEYIDVGH